MSFPVVLLYVCAAAVVLSGVEVVKGLSGGGRRSSPVESLRVLWGRPVPLVAAGMVACMVVMAGVQSTAPAVMAHLQRAPGAPWWRAASALLVQTSGWLQLTFNLAALIALAPAAQRALGPLVMPLVFLVSGVAAQAVSMAGWSPTRGGDSVALCGLVGALAVTAALRPGPLPARLLPLLIPAAGLVLCFLRNNHGVGLLTGCALGCALAALPARRLSTTPAA
ncbi:rhomboid family intramembrane serine protease [Streptomyces sp. NBC_00083]|uniref:rhomboid family intramembrane serine protease n=1 Tax=Streptomyces sp. NBC_00083 TaxID=2975647 RepID=UPI002259C1F5|nr:rhomboid family intramembrane serine protease [Streptomyces sp. NBC_00083]MCX5381848.1 rhomboid family intramembrane serine protease [Streptomyces sp. NBC_00083]